VDAVPGVRTGCAAAVADLDADGEHLLVFIEVREHHDGQADACANAIRARVGVSPDLVLLLDPGTLPRTSSGKIRRGETLARWKSGTLTPPEKVTPLMLAGAFARSALGFVRVAWRTRS
jgi:acyl-CoA synthetase (AMP-forming)/AMP-acid ligase II